jgi:hypothetical protein
MAKIIKKVGVNISLKPDIFGLLEKEDIFI